MTHPSGTAFAPTSRTMLALAIPALGTLAAEPLMGLLDTALVGHLGASPLAALGAATAVLNLILSLLIFLEYGTTARLARRHGAGRDAALARDAVQLAWIATVLGLLLFVLLRFGSGTLLRLVDVPDEARRAAATYLHIRAWGALPSLWIRLANGILRGVEDTRTPLRIAVAANVVNAVGDLLVIHGVASLGIPAFGIRGAAWATVIATWVGAAAFGPPLARILLPGLRASPGSLRPAWGPLREMLAMSRDIVFRTLGIMVGLFAGTRMAASLGTVALAAHQVGWQLWMFLALVLDSFAIAGQILVGGALGRDRPDLARVAGSLVLRWAFGTGVGFAALFLVLESSLPRVFTDDPAVLRAVGDIFVLLALTQIPNAILFAYDGLLIGASDFRFLRNAMIALGVSGILTTWLGRTIFDSLFGVWVGLGAYMVLRLVVMAARWRGGKWA